MDVSETAPVATSHVPGAMNYPSTTQALFALIVMIIVLLFILVYCCWGTFTCARQDEAAAPTPEDTTGPNSLHSVRHIIRGPHTVIVPINNMIYVGDPETHQIYQIPLDRDKPPAYTEVFRAGPPPPYRCDTEVSSSTTSTLRQQDNRTTLPESPPAYDACLSPALEECRVEPVSSQATSDLPQQPQQLDVLEASQMHHDTVVSQSLTPVAGQEAHEPSPRSRMGLSVNNSSEEPTQVLSHQSSPAGLSDAPPTTLHI